MLRMRQCGQPSPRRERLAAHHGLLAAQLRLQRAAPVQAPARLSIAEYVGPALGALHHRAAHACGAVERGGCRLVG